MAAPGAELELAAAVGRDVLLLAVVVRVEESLQRPEPRRLDVDRAWLPGQRLDVVDRVDDRVPRDAISMRLQDRPCLVGHGRILDQRIGEALDEEPVQPRVGRLVDHRAFVLAFEVEDVDAAELDELGDELLRPAAPRVELEAQPWIVLEPTAHRLRARRIAEAHRDDEVHRRGLATDRGGERPARLPQSQVQRGALKSPAAVVEVGRLIRLAREELEPFEQHRERVDGVRPRQLEAVRRRVVLRRVGHVLADPDLASAARGARRSSRA